MRGITHLPRRPVGRADIAHLDDGGRLRVVPYGGTEDGGKLRIYALRPATESTAHALGFDDRRREWQQVASADATDLAAVEPELDAALDEWVPARYGDQFEVLKSV